MKRVIQQAFVAVFVLLGSFLCAGGQEGRVMDNGGISAADRLGEEFQSQGPWTPKKKSRDYYFDPQPPEYVRPPGRELPAEEDEYGSESPLCYDPYSGRYEYCYPRDSSHFRIRFTSPEFRIWWGRERSCPPGYLFAPGRGCMRN